MYRRLISVKEAAELLNLSKSTIYKMVKERRLEFRKLGSRVLFDPEALGIQEKSDEKVNDFDPKKQKPEIKPKFETIPEDLIPELERAFKFVPAFREVGFKVVFHEGQPVRIETMTSVSRQVKSKVR
ncbi:MAG: helix-turn-helix domain-containing protein [Spirochaetales bacterium]|nr:helix-turn-helix domain-containing protein [Spirochaetales bacterium]